MLIIIACVLLFLIAIIKLFISKDIEGGIFNAALMVILIIGGFWKYPYMKDIERLRELVQQS